MHPRETPILLGQEDAEGQFLSAMRAGRLAHAWILSGPRGIGKATLAYRVARFLLSGADSSGNSLAVAENDSDFRLIAASGHPDLMVLERQTDERKERLLKNITVDDVRGLASFLHLTPARGAWRVVIIDSADDFNRNAANALLKMLEEPPARTLILMIAHEADRLLPTLRSRCRVVRLRPLSADLMIRVLDYLTPGDLAPQDKLLSIQLAEGSPGRALALCQDGGLDLYRQLTDLLSAMPDFNLDAILALGDRINRGDEGQIAFSRIFDFLTQAVADAMRVSIAGPSSVSMPPLSSLILRHIKPPQHVSWQALWFHLHQQHDRTENVNLDRKQNLLLAMQDIATLVRR